MTLYREADRLRPLLLPRGERGEQPQHSREGPNDKGQVMDGVIQNFTVNESHGSN